jgi:hypothetical protein
VTEDIEETLALENLLPKVARTVARFVLGIARSADDFSGMASLVERQEKRLLSRQPGGHVNFIGVSGEMYERALLKIEKRRSRVAIILVLSHGVSPGLPSTGILQFDGRHRQPVDRQRHVQRAIIARMARHLSGNCYRVLGKQLQHFRVRSMRGFEIG